MTSLFSLSRARHFGAVLLLGAAAAPSFAVPAMDMRLDDLVAMAPDFRQELKLNPNQQTLWQQVEAKTRHLLRERQARRERLDAALKLGLAAPKVELRELVGGLDAETAASAAEERQVRQWWLELNDALDEPQRQVAAAFLAAQLLRVQDGGAAHAGEPRRKAEGGERGHGGRKGGAGQPGS